ncbi:MAG: hypothetical protein ACOC1G_07855, partial [Phycisphaeraceae bacterium]
GLMLLLAGMAAVPPGIVIALAAPWDAGRGSLLGAMFLFAAPWVIPFLGVDPFNLVLVIAIALGAGLAGLLGMVLVIVFCREFAEYLGRDRLIGAAHSLMGMFTFCVMAYIGLLLLSPLGAMQSVVVSILLFAVSLVVSIACLVLCVRYVLPVGRLGIAALRA